MSNICNDNRNARAAPSGERVQPRGRRARAGTIALTTVALFAMVYGESWTLNRATVGGRELAAVASAIDAVSGRSNELAVTGAARVATNREDRHD